MLFVDLLDPIGVEQRRCRRTISQRKLLANGPRALVQICLKPVVSCAEPFARKAAVGRFRCSAGRNASKTTACMFAITRRSNTVEEANAPPELSVRNPAVGSGMVRLQMLDDASGFGH